MTPKESNLSPRTLAVGGVSLVGVGAFVAYYFGINSHVLLTLACGALGVSVGIVILVLYLRRRLHLFYGESDRSLMQVIRGRPAGVSDPELLARLDGFANKFEEGCRKYVEATGLAVSESPWYLLVGESGSGKTEAIRRCGVEFPEGLQEERQGAGGTTNMDWWFTEQAIILDTAGRFAIMPSSPTDQPAKTAAAKDLTDDPAEDVDDEKEELSAERERAARNSTQQEWETFLKRVAKARPNCPINGVVLVIPATSLLRDTPEQINSKGEELSRFLNGVRQTLGVRFPVFVLITKSDLIPGFREFFRHINNPEMAQQMLGWSKTGSLDDPFDPMEIDEYLAQVKRKLERKRLLLIADPVHTQLPGNRRIEQVDALYTFPHRFVEIAPKIRKYLGKLFVRSKFNQNPLFLRGIYFTSSMEEGTAIDEALARLRGVSLKQLARQGAGFRRERAVFLRDLFMKKIFGESRLVTREKRTDHLRRRRQIWTMGCAVAATGFLIVLTILGWQTIMKNVDGATQDWSAVNANYDPDPARWDFVQLPPGDKSTDPATIQWDAGSGTPDGSTIAAFLAYERDPSKSAIKTPWIYAPVSALLFSPEKARREAVEALIQQHLILDVMRTASARMSHIQQAIKSGKSDPFDAAAFGGQGTLTQAAIQLRQLSQLSHQGSNDGGELNMVPLLDFCLLPLDGTAPSTQPAGSTAASEARDWLAHVGGTKDLNQHLGEQFEQSGATTGADNGATAVAEFWTTRLDQSAAQRKLPQLAKLRDSLTKWKEAFELVEAQIPPQPVETLDDFTQRSETVKTQLKIMRLAATQADSCWSDLWNAIGTDADVDAGKHDVGPVLDLLSRELSADKTSALAAIDQLSRVSLNSPAEKDVLDHARQTITARNFDIPSLQKDGGLSGDDSLLCSVRAADTYDAPPVPHYRAITDLIGSAMDVMDTSDDQTAPQKTLAEELKLVSRTRSEIDAHVNGLVWLSPTQQPSIPTPSAALGQIHPAKLLFANLIAPYVLYRSLDECLKQLPDTAEEMKTQMAGSALASPLVPVKVPLASDYQSLEAGMGAAPGGDWSDLPAFQPDLAASRLRDIYAAGVILNGTDNPILDQPRLSKQLVRITDAAAKYAGLYIDFWSSRYPRPAVWQHWSGTDGLTPQLASTSAAALTTAINQRLDQCRGAIEQIKPALPPGDLPARASVAQDSLNSQKIGDELQKEYDAWASLAPGIPQAVGKLTGMSATDLYVNYLRAAALPPPVAGAPAPPGTFHRALFINALSVLARESADLQSKRYTALSRNWLCRFPFNDGNMLDPTARDFRPIRPLTVLELKRALASLNEAIGSDSSEDSHQVSAPSSDELSNIIDPDMRNAVGLLYSQSTSLRRVIAARDLAADLLDPNVTCRITVPEATKDQVQALAFIQAPLAGGRPEDPKPVDVETAKTEPFVVRAGGLWDVKWSPFGSDLKFLQSADNGGSDPGPAKLLELIKKGEVQDLPGETDWPATGREVTLGLHDENGAVKGNVTLKLQFFKDDKPISFPFPLPPDTPAQSGAAIGQPPG